MKFLLYSADWTNSRDGVITKGIHNLLKYCYKTYKYDYLNFDDEKTPFVFKEGYDAVIICGTPWLWDSFQKSIKWARLKELFKLYLGVPKIFLGIGDCVDLDVLVNYEDSQILKRPEEIAAMKEVYSNSLVIVRSWFAKKILDNANVKVSCLDCPSIFCFGVGELPKFSESDKSALIWTEPTKTISSGYWLRKPEKLKEYNELVLEYCNKYNPDVYTCYEREIPYAEKLGLKYIKLLKTPEDPIKLAYEYGRVLSGRVHSGVPSMLAKRNYGLLKIDSRYLTFEHQVDGIEENALEYKELIDNFLKK